MVHLLGVMTVCGHDYCLHRTVPAWYAFVSHITMFVGLQDGSANVVQSTKRLWKNSVRFLEKSSKFDGLPEHFIKTRLWQGGIIPGSASEVKSFLLCDHTFSFLSTWTRCV